MYGHRGAIRREQPRAPRARACVDPRRRLRRGTPRRERDPPRGRRSGGAGLARGGETFDADRIAARLETAVEGVAPDATFHDIRETRRLPRGAVAKRIRRFARDEDADLVVIGSENAGRIVTPVSSVGGGVATEMAYDVYLVRRSDSGLFPDVDIDLEADEES